MTMGQCNKMLEEMSFNALFQKLPVGIEVYDEREHRRTPRCPSGASGR